MIAKTDQEFLKQNPGLESVDLLLVDVNGQIRGKRVGAAGIEKIFKDGVTLPSSLFACDIIGNTPEETGLGTSSGDKDCLCFPIPGSLQAVPWIESGGGAQLMLDMKNGNDKTSCPISPRTILSAVSDKMKQARIRATLAVEMEFYLLQRKLDDLGLPVLPVNPASGQRETANQAYSMDNLDDYRRFIELIKQYTRRQAITIAAASSEYAPGQFEINLFHRDDPVSACDEAILLKRVIKQAARECGYIATFMAKPFPDLCGSGMHIHTGLYDERGDNLFSRDERNLTMAIGGLQHTMRDALLLYAPHANSYRRFQADSFAPANASWGYNNRTVALRVPRSKAEAMRVEHRVAGADGNPYLVAAAVLSGMLEGIACELSCNAAVEGNGYEQEETRITPDWRDAIDNFARSPWVEKYLGGQFRQVYTAIKRNEWEMFRRRITPLEIEWYLKNA